MTIPKFTDVPQLLPTRPIEGNIYREVSRFNSSGNSGEVQFGDNNPVTSIDTKPAKSLLSSSISKSKAAAATAKLKPKAATAADAAIVVTPPAADVSTAEVEQSAAPPAADVSTAPPTTNVAVVADAALTPVYTKKKPTVTPPLSSISKKSLMPKAAAEAKANAKAAAEAKPIPKPKAVAPPVAADVAADVAAAHTPALVVNRRHTRRTGQTLTATPEPVKRLRKEPAVILRGRDSKKPKQGGGSLIHKKIKSPSSSNPKSHKHKKPTRKNVTFKRRRNNNKTRRSNRHSRTKK
jgi:hypothetical protein